MMPTCVEIKLEKHLHFHGEMIVILRIHIADKIKKTDVRSVKGSAPSVMAETVSLLKQDQDPGTTSTVTVPVARSVQVARTE